MTKRPDNVAIFDLDRTLTRGGSFTPFILMIAREEPEKVLFVFAILFQMLLYVLKIRSRKELKEYMMAAFMNGMSRSEVAKFSKRFLERLEKKRKFHSDGLKAIEKHRKKGHLVVIATASMDFYAGDIAEKLKADHLIATRSVWQKGTLVPIIKGENCFEHEKAKRIQAFLAGRKVGKVWFYSDHHADLTSFELADFKVAVNPTRVLKKMAGKRGYEIQTWN